MMDLVPPPGFFDDDVSGPATAAVTVDHWRLLNVADLCEALPEVPWLVEAIGLAPGAVSMLAGYGYSRKTIAMQSLALSVASGRRVWGVYSCRQGPVVHLDYEQGRRLTQERYQRLARGMGFELRELPAGSLKVACMPTRYLDSLDVFEELCALCEGASLVIIDSLRAAFPKADENGSEAREYLDLLSRVSERTNACMIVLHHARKPGGPDQAAGETFAIRGTSALFDACQTVWFFKGDEEAGHTVVSHKKDRIRGATFEPFGITSVDIEGPNGPRWGLAVRHIDAEQFAHRAAAKESGAVEKAETRITKFLVDRGRTYAGSRRQAFDIIGGGSEKHHRVAWTRMLDDGRIVNEGNERAPSWRLTRT